MPIDYARMSRTHRVHKARLTRAINSGSTQKVMDACKLAIVEWDAIGCWPDDWHRWNIALGDVTMYRLTMDELARAVRFS